MQDKQSHACCRFLRMCPGLSRQLIGDILGENNERCLRVLECYTASFDFTGTCSHLHCIPALTLHHVSYLYRFTTAL